MRTAILVVLFAALLAGCSGVVMNAQYSALLDSTAALSAQTAALADSNQLTDSQMKTGLREQAKCWQRFRDARDGRAGK